MFVPDAEADFKEILQGDVIKDVPLVATLELAKVTKLGSSVWAYEGGGLRHGPCAVLSHSCEVAAENGEKVTSCILAPIRNADGATTGELFEILKKNEVKEKENNFIKYFYIPPTEKLPNANGTLVDFSKMFSVRKTSIPYLVERKILEMTAEQRLLLGRKVALYFFRGKDVA